MEDNFTFLNQPPKEVDDFQYEEFKLKTKEMCEEFGKNNWYYGLYDEVAMLNNRLSHYLEQRDCAEHFEKYITTNEIFQMKTGFYEIFKTTGDLKSDVSLFSAMVTPLLVYIEHHEQLWVDVKIHFVMPPIRTEYCGFLTESEQFVIHHIWEKLTDEQKSYFVLWNYKLTNKEESAKTSVTLPESTNDHKINSDSSKASNPTISSEIPIPSKTPIQLDDAKYVQNQEQKSMPSSMDKDSTNISKTE